MKTIKLKKVKALYSVIDGVKEVLSPDYVNAEVTQDKYRHPSSSQFKPDSNWQFGVSSGQVNQEIDQILKGYLSGRNLSNYKKVEAKVSLETKSEATAPVARRRRRRNEYDGEVCIDSYLAGSTDYYRKVSRVRTQNRIVRVIIGAAYNSSYGAEEIAEFNTKIVKRIEQIMKQGKMVEVYAAFIAKDFHNNSHSAKHAITLIRIKEADKGADFQRMLTASISGFVRYALFRGAQLAANKEGLTCDCVLGYPVNMTQNKDMLAKFVKAISDELKGEVLYLNGETDEGLKGISSKNL